MVTGTFQPDAFTIVHACATDLSVRLGNPEFDPAADVSRGAQPQSASPPPDGISRIGGILSDIFGKNGRLVIDGLLAARPSTAILDLLSGNVRLKLELLEDAISWPLSSSDRALLRDLIDEPDALQARIAAFHTTLADHLQPWRDRLDLLQTIPGINVASTCDILAELGPDLAVFDNAERLPAWADVCPGNHESAGNRKPAQTRGGKRHLATIVKQCAHAAVRTKDCQIHGYHRAIMIRRGYKRAIVATTHKMLRSIWAVLRDSHPYQDPAIDYDSLIMTATPHAG